LVIGAVELEPYEYAEAVSDAGIVRLVARALISQANLDTLSLSPDVVPVRRVGISDTPREMTFAYLWGERPDGLAVVLRCVDAREPRITLESATLSTDTFGDLVSLLAARGVLDEADLAHLRHQRHAARHVSNIDGWPVTD
jgi:hypothetical protein